MAQSNPPLRLTPREAFTAIALAIAAADGCVTPLELDMARQFLRTLRLFQDSDEPSLENTLVKLEGLLREGGMMPLADAACRALNPDLSRSAFVCALDIALIDRHFDVIERAMMGELQKMLGLSEAFTQAAIEVMTAKHQLRRPGATAQR
ncbi:MAG: tellurite resistance TerB family protein [Candidatus Competibacterales bacterium]